MKNTSTDHTKKKLLKLDKKSQKKIETIRKLIEKHRQEEDKAIEKLAKSMGIDIDNVEHFRDYEVLNDYIYNDSSWMVELEQ